MGNRGKHWLRWPGVLLTVVVVVVAAALPGITQAYPHQQNESQNIAHLVIGIEGDPTAIGLNRATWEDFEVTVPVSPGMSVLPRDYFVISGSSSFDVLCADLSVASLFSNGVVDCPDRPENPALRNMNGWEWEAEDVTVFVREDTETSPEAETVDTEALDSETAARVQEMETTIIGLDLDGDVQAFVTAHMLASQGLYYDAINVLRSADGVQCTQQRPFVEAEDEDAPAIMETAAPYLRLGEWYAVVDGAEASTRYLNCAREAAAASGDLLTEALALTRLAVLAEDASERTDFYQTAIDNLAQLSANDTMAQLIELCGSANCSRP